MYQHIAAARANPRTDLSAKRHAFRRLLGAANVKGTLAPARICQQGPVSLVVRMSTFDISQSTSRCHSTRMTATHRPQCRQ